MTCRKRTPGQPCCDCPYCQAMRDDFENASIDPDWSTIRGPWEEVAGLLRTNASNAQIVWWGERPCDTNMVVIAQGVDTLADGNIIYIITNYGSGSTNETGFLFAKITRHATNNFDLAIGELEADGDAENILDSLTGLTSAPQYIQLCYHTGLGKLSLVTTADADPVLEAIATISVGGRRAGIASGAVTSGHVQVSDFAIYKRDDDCKHCNVEDCACDDCSYEVPCNLTVVLGDTPATGMAFDPAIHDGAFDLPRIFIGGAGVCQWLHFYHSSQIFCYITKAGGDYTLWCDVVYVDLTGEGDSFHLVFKKTYFAEKPDCASWDDEQLTYSPSDSQTPAWFTGAPTCHVTSGAP